MPFCCDSFLFRYAKQASRLSCPSDITLASKLIGANCGPASFAAALECDVLGIMEYFPQFPKKPYTTIKQMRDSFFCSGIAVKEVSCLFPSNGVSLLQFLGPWTSKRSPRVLRYTHWVAVKGDLIYDLNWGGWLPLISWEAIVFPMFKEINPRITGWRILHSFHFDTRLPL